MIEYLQQQGWICKVCSCVSKSHHDCLTDSHKGIMIRVNKTGKFKIYRKGLLIKQGNYLSELKIKVSEII
jgi:hypothetical protein